MLRVFETAFYEMCLDIPKPKLVLKEVDNELLVDAVVTGVDIDRNELAFREGVDADMALRDDDKAAPTARVLDLVVWCRNDNRI